MDVKVFLFGLVFVAAGVFALIMNSRLKKSCTESTDGTVTGQETRRGSKGRTYYYPILTYRINGVEYKHSSTSGSRSPQCPEGQKIPLKYNPAKPEQCYVVSEGNHSLIIGLIAILAGVGIAIFSFFYKS